MPSAENGGTAAGYEGGDTNRSAREKGEYDAALAQRNAAEQRTGVRVKASPSSAGVRRDRNIYSTRRLSSIHKNKECTGGFRQTPSPPPKPKTRGRLMSAATRALEAYGCSRGPLVERGREGAGGGTGRCVWLVYIARLRPAPGPPGRSGEEAVGIRPAPFLPESFPLTPSSHAIPGDDAGGKWDTLALPSGDCPHCGGVSPYYVMSHRSQLLLRRSPPTRPP